MNNRRNTGRTNRGGGRGRRGTQRVAAPELTPQEQLALIQQKFDRIRELDTQIQAVRPMYEERSRLIQEVLPMFMTIDADQITINRQLTVGRRTVRLSPYWLDTRTNTIKDKVWKAAAFETFTLE